MNYQNDDTWRQVQEFLPLENRLTADNMPDRPFSNFKNPMKSVCNMRAIVNNEALAVLLMKDKKSSGAAVTL